MKECLADNDLLINLDQFFIHMKPVYEFTQKMQSLNGNIQQLLLMLLELLSKLLIRLGHNATLSMDNYFKKLFKDDKTPLQFTSKSDDFKYSKDIPAVYSHLCKSDNANLERIEEEWKLLNEAIFRSILYRFMPFLSSMISRKCYVLFKNIKSFSDTTVKKLKSLADEIKLSPVDVGDEYARLTVVHGKDDESLIDLHGKGNLSEYPLLTKMATTLMVICPHNMMVEAGFSKMKFFEDEYQSNLSLEMYNAFRSVGDHFHRDSYEDFEPTASLLNSISFASKEYKLFCEESKTTNGNRTAIAESLRREIGVFKRKTNKELQSEMVAADQDIRDAEAALLAAKRRKIELEQQRNSDLERQDRISDAIISNMFGN